MGIIIGKRRITSYTKTDREGFHAENEIFADEEFMVRLPMSEDIKMPPGKTIEYYCFSISSDNTYKIEVSRGEELEKDKRPYNTYAVYSVFPSSAKKSDIEVHQLMEAKHQLMEVALKKRMDIFADIEDLAEAMCEFGKYIPQPLREKLIFSADDTVSSGVIPVKEGVPESADRYIKEYCSSPEKYFSGFDEVIKKSYAKGGFGGDEYFLFCKYMADFDKSCENRDKEKSNKDRTIEFKLSRDAPHSRKPPDGYPDIGKLDNKLYALAHINRAYKYSDIVVNTKIWSSERLSDIVEFINIIKNECRTTDERLNLLEYVRPSMNSKREYLFESLVNMLAGSSDGTSSALVLMLFYDNEFPYRKSAFQGADPFRTIVSFYRKERPDRVAVKTLIKKVRRSAGFFHTLKYMIFLR